LIHLSFSFDSIDYRKVKEEKIISTKKKAINESVKPVFPLPKKDLYNIPRHLALFNLEKLRKGLDVFVNSTTERDILLKVSSPSLTLYEMIILR
jgi:hypothetical protein